MAGSNVLRWSGAMAALLLGAQVVALSGSVPGAAGVGTAGVVGATTVATAQAPLSAAQAVALSTDVTHKVIVVYRDQAANAPDTRSGEAQRTGVVQSIQAPVLAELAATGARNVKSLRLVNAVTATVSPGEAQRLKANPAVAEVVPDEPIPVAAAPTTVPAAAAPGTGVRNSTSARGPTLPAGTCMANGGVQLNPEAIVAIHAASQAGTGQTAQALGYTGAGVKVAFIADGLDINNPDFIRANSQHVFTDYQDFSGSGTSAPSDGREAFLDASSIAAQGLHTYDVQPFAGYLTKPCLIRVLGVAPGASLVGLDVLGDNGSAYASVFLQAIDYAVNVDHVNVINESFDGNPFPDTGSLDLIRLANDAAVAAGVTVTASSGDAGVTNTIGSPASDPNVISAGASTTYRAYAQADYGNVISHPGVTGWLDNNVSALSSSGFDSDGSTVDVVAPGDVNWALCTPNVSLYHGCTDFFGNPASLEVEGGTSEAAPLTAGVAALVIQAYAQSHAGADPTPAVVKQIITSTAEDIDAPADQQGAGLLDAYQAVLAAGSYAGGTAAAQGHAIMTSAAQLNAVGQPGSTQVLGETLRNDGKTALTLTLAGRTLGSYAPVESTTATLSDSTGNSAVVSFHVPAGQARLNAAIAFPGTAANNGASLSLIDPNGKYAAYSLPQGFADFDDTQVADPVAGTWTAIIAAGPSAYGGFVGPVQFGASVAPWAPFGTLSATTLHLAAGASAPVTLTVATPAAPGDQSGSIEINSSAVSPSFARVSSVPVTLRSLVPAPAPTTTFTGSLTGGNGRSSGLGQGEFYEMQVPAGLRALNVEISTPNAANSFNAELIDPATGEAASTASNSPTGTAALGTQLHVLHPDAGLWKLSINFYGPVPGTVIAQPFSVSINDTPVKASAAGLPDSATTKLAAGTPVTVNVKVTNQGTTPEEYFVDGRLDQPGTYPLASPNASATVPLTGAAPEYVVPSHTTSITATASATAPIYFDYFWYFGDPDLFAGTPPADTVSGTFTSSNVADGLWQISPFQAGPVGAAGVTPVTAQTSMTVTTAAFDPSIGAPTGDLWLQSIVPSAPSSPKLVQPGKATTIPVTITPSGPVGTTMSGTLYVAGYTPVYGIPLASDLAAFNYEYTIG